MQQIGAKSTQNSGSQLEKWTQSFAATILRKMFHLLVNRKIATNHETKGDEELLVESYLATHMLAKY